MTRSVKFYEQKCSKYSFCVYFLCFFRSHYNAYRGEMIRIGWKCIVWTIIVLLMALPFKNIGRCHDALLKQR